MAILGGADWTFNAADRKVSDEVIEALVGIMQLFCDRGKALS